MKNVKYFEVSKKRLIAIAHKKGFLFINGMSSDVYVFKHSNIKLFICMSDLMPLFTIRNFHFYFFRLRRKSGNVNEGI